jgi:hypothetical protein
VSGVSLSAPITEPTAGASYSGAVTPVCFAFNGRASASDVLAIERPQHADVRVHRRPATFRRNDQRFDRG